MRKISKLTILALFAFAPFAGKTQDCPNESRNGVHVVKKGETYYAISRKYKISVEELLTWNSLQASDVLEICQELAIRQPSKTANQAPATEPTEGKRVDPEESRAKSRISGQFGTRPSGEGKVKMQETGTHVVREGESLADIARTYGYTTERFCQFNNISTQSRVHPGQELQSWACSCPGGRRVMYAYVIPPKVEDNMLVTANGPQFNVEKNAGEDSGSGDGAMTNANSGTGHSNGNSTNKLNASSNTMTKEELQMVAEINLLRTNPAGYVKYVQEYYDKAKLDGNGQAMYVAKELMAELKALKPLRALKPSECIYQAARRHGADQSPTGDINHQGRDGLQPWQRIEKSCGAIQDGSENIVAGPSNIRDAMLELLVDWNIEGRGHRKNLLNPNWEYVSCHKVGKVGGLDNWWLQNFAY